MLIQSTTSSYITSEIKSNWIIVPEIIDNEFGGTDTHVILSWSLQSLIRDVTVTAIVNDIAMIREYHKAGIVLNSRPKYKKDTTEER